MNLTYFTRVLCFALLQSFYVASLFKNSQKPLMLLRKAAECVRLLLAVSFSALRRGLATVGGGGINGPRKFYAKPHHVGGLQQGEAYLIITSVIQRSGFPTQASVPTVAV